MWGVVPGYAIFPNVSLGFLPDVTNCAKFHSYCTNSFFERRDSENWVFPLTSEMTFTTAREL